MDQRIVRPRIDDVAREAGVSKTAVSFAFNSPDRLAPETAARIRTVAERLGYSPHPVARMLTQRETRTIGILTPQPLSVIFSNPFFAAFAQGVATTAEASGYALQFISPLQGSLALAMRRATVDGVVAVGLSADHPDVDEIRRAGTPIVLVDSSALPDLPSIAVDDIGGARAAAEHIVELGHRDVLIIGVEAPAPAREMDPLGVEPPAPGRVTDTLGVTARRLRGYRDALAAAGIDADESRLVLGPATIEGGRAALDRAWATDLRPTAVLAMSDAMAIGALDALRAMGLETPGDVSVVGFDDIELAAYVDPPLTTVHQPIERKGEEAIELLLGVLAGSGGGRSLLGAADRGRGAPEPEHRVLETRLVVRASTAPVRAAAPVRASTAPVRASTAPVPASTAPVPAATPVHAATGRARSTPR